MRHSEIHKFCDVTLNRVLEGLKSYNNDVKYGYVQKELTNDEVEYLKLLEEDIENTCNNDKSLSEIQLEHEKEDELVVVVVKMVHELDCRMVVKEIEDGLLEEMEKFRWWFEQDIDGECEDDNEKKLVMVNEEGCMS
ncbi:hypothetical protein Tco_0733472 [Tanacetum coccineum]